jgi:adenylylsulfate kinase-like enzyme
MPATRGWCVWLTGRVGAGKTTVATAVLEQLRTRGASVALVDEPEVGAHLDQGDRLAALVWVISTLADAGVVALVAADEPRRGAREEVRAAVPSFVEVFVDAGSGSGSGSDDYEEPYAPELRVPTRGRSPEASAAQVVSWLEDHGALAVETTDGPQTQSRRGGSRSGS